MRRAVGSLCAALLAGAVAVEALLPERERGRVGVRAERPGCFPDSYYAATCKEPMGELRPGWAEQPATTVDTCIVGGGLAGLSTALCLAEQGRSAVVFESKRVGWAASGRNGGFALPGLGVDAADLIADMGPDLARRIYQRTLAAGAALRRWVRDYNIRCDLDECGSLAVSAFDDGDDAALAERVQQENSALGSRCQFWSRERCARHYPGSDYRHGVFDPDAFVVQPLALCLGLARAAESRGVVICENSPVQRLAHVADTGDGRRFRLTLASGRTVHCRNVVLAGSCHLDPQLDWLLACSVTPVRSYIAVTPPLPAATLAAVVAPDAPFAVYDDLTAISYFRPLADGRLLWGSRLGPSLDVDRYSPVVAERICDLIASHFPAAGRLPVEYTWGGDMAFTLSQYPLIGVRRPGLFYATGFGGDGVIPTAMSGQMIADAIASNDYSAVAEYQRLCPPIYCGYPLDRAVAQLVIAARSLHDAAALALQSR